MKKEIKNFKLIWSSKRSDLKQWIFYNLFLGLSPIFLSWLPLIFGRRFSKMADPLFNGTVLIFAVTLTAASLSFFAEESQRKLKETRRFLWNWLLCIMIFSAAGYTAIISLTEFSPSSISLPICGAVSFVMFLGAGFLNLHLAAVRLACTDSELVAKMLSNEPVELAAEAKTTTEVDGINL